MHYCALFIAILSCNFLTACESTVVHFSGSPTTTSVAGTSSSNVHTLSVAGDEYGVYSIEWAEGGVNGGLDRPCFMKVGFRRLGDVLDPSAPANLTYREVNVCNSASYTNSSKLIVDMGISRESYATGNVESIHLYMNEVQTCDSSQSSNDRIKGVAMWGSFINGATPNPADYECHSSAGGASASSPCQEHDVRRSVDDQPNCGTWSSRVACPGGTIASGVHVYVQNTNEMVGLALDCDSVVYETPDEA